MTGENVVDLDPAQLEAEAEALGATLDAIEPDTAEPGAPAAPAAGEGAPATLDVDQAAALAASYEAGAFILFSQTSRIIAPNWRVTDAENRELAAATALALSLWFPDQQLPPKYAALLAVAGVAYSIAEARRDPATGRIRPLKEPPADADPDRQRGFEFTGAPAAASGPAMFGAGGTG